MLKNFIRDFKKFISRGNVIDLAIAVIIGAAFKSIVDSFVNDILNGPLGYLLGGVNLSDLKIILGEYTKNEQVVQVTINYGAFLQAILNFFIIALSLFLLIKISERLRKRIRKAETSQSAPQVEVVKAPTTEEILTDIKNLLEKMATKEQPVCEEEKMLL